MESVSSVARRVLPLQLGRLVSEQDVASVACCRQRNALGRHLLVSCFATWGEPVKQIHIDVNVVKRLLRDCELAGSLC